MDAADFELEADGGALSTHGCKFQQCTTGFIRLTCVCEAHSNALHVPNHGTDDDDCEERTELVHGWDRRNLRGAKHDKAGTSVSNEWGVRADRARVAE